MPLNSDLFIGFDGGGTKTMCIIGDAKGTILACATGASTNLKSRSSKDVKEVIHTLLAEVLQSAHANKEQVKGIFVSTAGGDREEDRERWKQWIFEYGLVPNELTIVNDAVGALTAGTKTNTGIVLIAGTGSIAYAVKEGNTRPIRSGGWGYLLGDEGSGYDIGNQALKMILRAYDGRGHDKGTLTTSILEQTGLENPEQLITYIYEDPYPRKLIANLAKHVVLLAEQGETNAKDIIQCAIEELVELVKSVIRHDQACKAFPLVIAGGLFSSHYFREEFERTMRINGWNQSIISPQYPPIIGSYMCAILQNGEIITDQVEQNINNSWQRALKVV